MSEGRNVGRLPLRIEPQETGFLSRVSIVVPKQTTEPFSALDFPTGPPNTE